jgi:hypothetical protein
MGTIGLHELSRDMGDCSSADGPGEAGADLPNGL